MRYIDKILTLQSDAADNALILGHAIHTGIEKGVNEGIKEYFMAYPIITDNHINEAIKLEYLIPKVQQLLPKGTFELQISDKDFVGFMDLLSPVEPTGTFDLYDFKYSNNAEKYAISRQLHIYKYQFEKLNPGKHIRDMYFVMIPKVNIKQKKDEDLFSFRKRIENELSKTQIELLKIPYNPNKVIEHWILTKRVLETTDFPKEQSWLCRYCEYEDYCMKGNDYMLLPENKRRNIEKIEKKVIWIYGMPFSGKTFFANKFPDPLMVNTDGNIKFVDAPYIRIKDEIIQKGRMQPERKFAWEVFKDTVDELEKKDNTFKTIVVDLLEDMYEHCRVFMCNQMGISHESDDSFKAWDKVRSEFLNTIKRLVNLDYENIILISHEDTSKDIMKKGGDKITAIKPNLQDKVANKIAGMVDIVARAIAEGNNYTLSFKTSEIIFGGGRLTVSKDEIPSDYDAFTELYQEANKNAVAILDGENVQAAPTGRRSRAKKDEEEPVQTEPENVEPPENTEKELAEDVQDIESNAEMNVAVAEEIEPNTGENFVTPEAPKVRTRRKRGE